MLKKLVSKILVLALCASTLAALPQPACAREREEPTPIVIVEPEESTPSEEPEEPDVLPASESSFPEEGSHPIVT